MVSFLRSKILQSAELFEIQTKTMTTIPVITTQNRIFDGFIEDTPFAD